MTTYAFGFRAYPRHTALTLDQREYVAHMLQLLAEATATALTDVAREAFAADLLEWRGIAKACERERNRCARLSRAQKGFAAEALVRGTDPARRPA